MRPLKEAVLLFLGVSAIAFSYLLAVGVFLFALADVFRPEQPRYDVKRALDRSTSSFSRQTLL